MQAGNADGVLIKEEMPSQCCIQLIIFSEYV